MRKTKRILAMAMLCILFFACNSSKRSSEEAVSVENSKPASTTLDNLIAKETDTLQAEVSKTANDQQYLDGQCYFKLKESSKLELPNYNSEKGQIGEYPALSEIISAFGVQEIKQAFPGLKNKTYRMSYDSTKSFESLQKAFNQLDFIDYIEQIPLNK